MTETQHPADRLSVLAAEADMWREDRPQEAQPTLAASALLNFQAIHAKGARP